MRLESEDPWPGGSEVKADVTARVVALVQKVLSDGTVEASIPSRLRGMSSITAARLHLEIRREFAVNVAVRQLGECSDVHDLAARILGAAGVPADGGEPGKVLADPAARFTPFPLTPMQEAYFVGRQADGDADRVGCHLYREFEVEDLDAGRLRESWDRLVIHHDALRTVVTVAGQQVIQKQAGAWDATVHDCTRCTPAQWRERIRSVRAKMSHRRFAAGEWPLFAIEVSQGRRKSLVHFGIDGIVVDGKSLEILMAQWRQCYENRNFELRRPELSFRDSVMILRAWRNSPSYRSSLRYWDEVLESLPAGPELGWAGSPARPPHLPCLERGQHTDVVEPSNYRALLGKAASLGVSATSVLLTLFGEALARHGARPPFSLVLTTSSRLQLPDGAEDLVAPLTSTAIFVSEDTRARTREDACRHTHEQVWRALEHAEVCAVTALRRRPGSRGAQPFLPVVFTSLLDAQPPRQPSFLSTVTYAASQTTGVFLDHQISEDGGGLRFHTDYAKAALPPETVEAVLASFLRAVRSFAEGGSRAPELRPLNELQKAYYVARAVDGREGCQVYHSFRVEDLDPRRLTRAWRRMVTDHEVLRSTITAEGGLRVHPAAPDDFEIPEIDLTGIPGSDVVLAELRDVMAARPFPLGCWPPFDLRITRARPESRDAVVHCAIDLGVADGKSVHLLFRELFRSYADDHAPRARPRLARDGFARRVADRAGEEAYWERRFRVMPPGPRLPIVRGAHAARKRARLAGHLACWQDLKTRAREHGVDPDMVLLAAFAEALSTELDTREFSLPVVRWTASDDLRPGELTVLSWVTRAADGIPLLERARLFQAAVARDEASGSVGGLGQLRNRVMKERRKGSFDLPVVYTSVLELADFSLPDGVAPGPWMTYTPDVSLDCIGVEESHGLGYFWDAVENDFQEGCLEAMFRAFRTQLESLGSAHASWEEVDAPRPAAESAGSSPASLSQAERRRILYDWNRAEVDFPTDTLPHRWFESQASRRPDAVALRSRSRSLSYAELNRRANRIAWRLKSRGVGPETVVAVCCRRRLDMITAVLAIAKAGGAYLPLEPSLPNNRLVTILRAAGASRLVTNIVPEELRLPADVDTFSIQEILRQAREPAHDPGPSAEAGNTAYVIFTSGSTGEPKGVAVTHRSLLNLLHWCYRSFGFHEDDLGLSVASLSFDLSVFDIFGLLGCGAGIFVADEARRQDPGLLMETLLNEPITFWNSAPAALGQLSHFLESGAGRERTGSLRLVFLSGDFTPLHLPARVRRIFPRSRIVNLGGATEATVWSNFFILNRIDPHWRSIPYGKPIDNCRYHVVDPGFEPVPPGVEGDLYIAGECLAIGYLNRPGLTAERYLPDPFSESGGERMYWTGDRASYFPDGNLLLHGRVDRQVKIRGFRVELEEIEHHLRRHPDVQDVVLTTREDPSGDRKLVAYVVPKGGSAPSAREVRAFAADNLADYMVPNFVGLLETLPVTSNGKLDRDALPWPLNETVRAPRPGADRERLESEVSEIFASLLGAGTLDPRQDLWDQGATSFTMVQASHILYERYGRRLETSVLLSDPTVAGVARHLASATDPAAGSKGALPEEDVPAVATAPLAGARSEGPPSPAVEFFSKDERERFKLRRLHLRQAQPGDRIVELDPVRFDDEHYDWRSSRSTFLKGTIPHAAFCRFLSLLRTKDGETVAKRLYPSAGATYSVQVYLHLKREAVEGLDGGLYYYHPERHALQMLSSRPAIDRSCHFVYNRAVFDESVFGIFLIGQLRGIEPLYADLSERFLTLEAGYMGQLLMMGQAASGIGLCPVGDVSFEKIRADFALDGGHRFLHGFLGGPAPHAAISARGERPPFGGRGRIAAEPAAVAVVGLAGRYPEADDPEELWRNLTAGKISVGDFPSQRRGFEAVEAVAPGGFLKDIERFDNLLFHISPEEARRLDPQLRLLLETVWECLENAGYTSAALKEQTERVGVFVGGMWSDYSHVGSDQWKDGGAARVSGLASDLANRVSYFFDFKGPSLAVDSACASSASAIQLACASLRSGECDAAVAAGVNLLAYPYHLHLLREFDLVLEQDGGGALGDGPSGWHPGEGCGAVLLRPARKAEQLGDFIHGVIEGAWTGHSGRTRRFGAPDAGALAASISAALENAGRAPGDIDYVESAAAGAALADAAEMEALATVFAGRPGGRVPAGTIKPNIGHLEAAAGISQLTKALLQMRHGELAPTRLAVRPSPLVPWSRLPVRFVRAVERIDVPADREACDETPGRPFRILINSLGATGTASHLIVRSQAAPPGADRPPAEGPRVIVLSAASRGQLESSARRLRQYLARIEEEPSPPSFEDVAFTLQTGRVAMEHRLALRCGDLAGLKERLDDFLRGRAAAEVQTAVVGEGGPAPGAEPPAGDDPADLWLQGRDVAWERYWSRPARRVPLPTYPFAAESHWLGTDRGSSPVTASQGKKDLEPARIVRELREIYSQVSGISLDQIHARVPFERYGLSSYQVTQLNGRIEKRFGRVSRTLFFDYPDLAGVAAHLAERERASRSRAVEAPAWREIAVVGIAGRYPKARNLDELWSNLLARRDCVTMLPAGRRREGWPVERMWGGFLDDVDLFDPLFFGITPADADFMDPQERLFLEVVWETLEDAAYTRQSLRDLSVGVFAGSMYNEYSFFGVEQSARGVASASGSTPAGIANRVSYFLDFHGPSLAVDTMCSSSLTAIHLACESLQRGECDLAIAGGVNLSLHPDKYRRLARLRMASSDHRCRSFGSGGDGFVPGEGVGAVLLKPLAEALADGDRVHAIIKGTAINHGGRTNGYTVPSSVSQGELIEAAIQRAGVDPGTISYLEAHGTGTDLGDPVEIAGLERAFGGPGRGGPRCAVGSIKSNIGHLEAAAGIAGLTKVILQMRHSRLVPSLHAGELNPNIDWERSPFFVQRESSEWSPDGDVPLRAGVSSFGAGGANAHVILEALREEAVRAPAAKRRAGQQLVVVSAADKERLVMLAGRLADFLAGRGELELEDVAFTLQTGREALRERLAIVASDLAEARDELARFSRGEAIRSARGRAPSTGEGAGPGDSGVAERGGDLEAWARHWVAGGAVDWARLHAGRSPRRIGLPSYPFSRRRCWLREADEYPVAAGQREIPIYEKSWTPALGVEARRLDVEGRTICLFHEGSEHVARELAAALGPDRVLLAHEKNMFPGETAAVRWMRSQLDEPGGLGTWIDLCDLYRDRDDPGSWRARAAMLQMLLRERTGPVVLLHVTQGLLELSGPPPSLAGARMASTIKAIAAERSDVTGRVVDTDATRDRFREAAGHVSTEMTRWDDVTEVCYRRDVLFRPRLELSSRPETDAPPSLDEGKVYVVTGASGKLGALAARFLVNRGARKLALLCRGSSGDGTSEHPMEEQRRALEAAGAEVAVYAGRLTSRRELERFFDTVRDSLGAIGGVLHCAGTGSRGLRPFAHRPLEEIQKVFEPKVDGLLTLAELCEADDLSFFVLFSSASAVFPRLASGITDYAAANAFMDFFAAYRRGSGSASYRSINWPPWTEGADRGSRQACARIGLGSLSNEEGLRVLGRRGLEVGGAGLIPGPESEPGVDPQSWLAVEPPGSSLEDPALPPSFEGEAESPPVRLPERPGEPAPGHPRPWLVRLFAETLRIHEKDLAPDVSFEEYGVESVMLGELLLRIEEHLGRSLDPSILLRHPTLAQLSEHLGEGVGERVAASAGSRRRGSARAGDVAVIGIGCRFPGSPDVETFWMNLCEGSPQIREVPPTRWDPRIWYRSGGERVSVSKWGGFVEGIEDFDPDYFGLTDREAECLDPAIRLFLETSAACFADAGYRDEELRGRGVGIFAGARMSDYGKRVRAAAGGVSLAGDQNLIAAYAAHHFDLHGPNLVIDAACSSSLVSVHLACQSLLQGESEMALAGGVEVLLDQEPYLQFSAAGILSPSGKCFTFDERADGFVPGEGCGAVLLKPLAAALRDGDRVYAVVRASAVNNDGRTIGLTTPNPAMQSEVIRKALADSGLSAGDIGMVEAHGSATVLGDPIELRALTDVFREATDRKGFCAVGSVKTNIGHLLSAAGIAGLIKAVLAVHHGEIPPTLFCERPNPRFDFDDSPFYPALRSRQWPAKGGVRAAGVSAFGLGGTNAHVIVSEPDRDHQPGGLEARRPLPPPAFHRRRLWLEEEDPAPRPALSEERVELVESLLELSFGATQ